MKTININAFSPPKLIYIWKTIILISKQRAKRASLLVKINLKSADLSLIDLVSFSNFLQILLIKIEKSCLMDINDKKIVFLQQPLIEFFVKKFMICPSNCFIRNEYHFLLINHIFHPKRIFRFFKNSTSDFSPWRCHRLFIIN